MNPFLDPPLPQSPLAAPDPNWFYSTMSQSAAALIGFLGGILITRLMDYKNAHEFQEARDRVVRHLIVWRHNVLVHAHNLLRATDGERSATFEAVLKLAESDHAFTSVRRFRRLIHAGQKALRDGKAADGTLPQLHGFVDLENDLTAEVRGLVSEWERFNLRLWPVSLYVMFVTLLGLGWVGLLRPLQFLAGFNFQLFWWFRVGFLALSGCIAWLLFDLSRANRIRPHADAGYLTRRPAG